MSSVPLENTCVLCKLETSNTLSVDQPPAWPVRYQSPATIQSRAQMPTEAGVVWARD